MTKVYMRLGQGCLLPADATQTSILRNLGLESGGVIEIDIKQVRSVKFNSLVHKIGDLLVKNCDAFTGIDAHLAIKRLQLEGCIECDIVGIMLEGYGIVEQRIPRSIAFDRMSEDRYRAAAKAICDLIAEKYWSGMTQEQIERMADLMIE